ncbi:MAG: recombinase family protein [Clostridia bacterium]|nr:recombinase family protein [Clostridia bacterium]
MRLAGYLRGAREDPCAIINGFLKVRGMEPVQVFSDPMGEFRSLRSLQNAVKHELYDAVILPSYDDLGDDRYSRLENELFFRRNGVRLIFIKRPAGDGRRGIIIAAKRFSSFVTEWDQSFGLSMPEYGNAQYAGSNIPFGYTVKDGAAVVEPNEAACVEAIFEGYIAGKSIKEILASIPDAVSKRGKRFSNMTVKTVLKNPHYLGMRTKKGILLPPAVKYGTWLKAKARLEREYGREQTLKPYFGRVYLKTPMRFARYVKSPSNKEPVVYSDALEKALESLIAAIAKDDGTLAAARVHIETELAEAEKAYHEAVKENNRILSEFRSALDRITEGDRSEKAQDELERLTDLKAFSAMRIRRILSEKELYSIGIDKLCEFLDRAKIISELSVEDRAFITEAFVDSVRIRDGRVTAKILDPASGRSVPKELEGIIG